MDIYTFPNFPPVYSTQSAVGLILATGNTGSKLSDQDRDKSLYISRDGGIEWKLSKTGNWIYEIGDHGAIIVIARKNSPTKTLQFSLDEGITWQSFNIADDYIIVENIIIEPKSISAQFLVHGRFQ